jgi:hypothetical protein
MTGLVKIGTTVGNGAALNIICGFVPDMVELYNATDGTPYQAAFLNWVVPFTSGGTTEISAGAEITGATSAATARVSEVLLISGTWAGGNAAGFFVLEEGSLDGTFQTEAVYISSDSTTGADDASVTANVVHNCAISTAAAAVAAGNDAISRYEGTAAGYGKGFTIGSGLAVEAKVLRWRATRSGN